RLGLLEAWRGGHQLMLVETGRLQVVSGRPDTPYEVLTLRSSIARLAAQVVGDDDSAHDVIGQCSHGATPDRTTIITSPSQQRGKWRYLAIALAARHLAQRLANCARSTA